VDYLVVKYFPVTSSRLADCSKGIDGDKERRYSLVCHHQHTPAQCAPLLDESDCFFEPEFGDLCGFRQKEVAKTLGDIATACGLGEEKASEALEMMHTYYNGYNCD